MYYDRKISASMRERKKLACALELKSIDGQGRFAGYASVFGVLDNQKDIILRGAFLDTIRNRVPQIKLLWQHQPEEPIGVFNLMFEDARGLYVEGQLLLGVARAREALALLKAGAISGLSIGYSPVRYAIDPDTGVRKLAEVELWEVSLVTFPANGEAGVTVVKSFRPPTTPDLLQLGVAASCGMQALAEIACKSFDPAYCSAGEMSANDNLMHGELYRLREEGLWLKSYTQMLEVHMFADHVLARKYSPDQPRDDHGRWTNEWDDGSTDSGGGAPPDQIPNDTNTNNSSSQPDPYPDRIDPVYPIENAIGLAAGGNGLLGAAERAAAEGEAAADTEWSLGAYKSEQTWANQMEDRNWTPNKITDTLTNGEQFSAPNNINPGNTATRYEYNGNFVVRDDATKEIIQLGRPDFVRPAIPNSTKLTHILCKERSVKMSNTVTVYVNLLDEGTPTWRPTQAVPLEGGVYRLLPTPDYKPRSELWEFLPGSIVKCEPRIADRNQNVLLAVEKVQ